MRRIKILRKAKRELRFRGANGICTAIASVLSRKTNNKWTLHEVYKLFPLLTKSNAERFRSEEDYYCIDGYWWKRGDFGLFSGRRQFMRWLIKQYRADKTELKI